MTIAAWCILAAYILAYLPRAASIKGAMAQDGAYEINDPRAQQARLTGTPARAQAAHQNMLEGFGPFAAAVILAHLFNADAGLRDGLALAYVAARLIYWRAYVKAWGYGRSGLWIGIQIIVIVIFASPVML